MAAPAAGERKLTQTVRRRATDPETGQVLDLEWEETLKRRPADLQKSAEPFGLIFPDAVARLAQLDLTGADLTVLLHLVGIMGFEEPFTASPLKIGQVLGMKGPNVSRSLARLRREGILLNMPHRKVLIHPDYFWRGSLRARVHMLARLERARKEQAP